MSTYLNNRDTNSLFSACVLGAGPELVSETPMVRKQGNGCLTGFIRRAYSDGSTVDCTFIENAASIEAVKEAFHANSPLQLGRH